MASTLEDAVVKIKEVVARSGFSTEDTTTFNDNLDTYTTAEIVNLNIENRYNYKIQYEEEFNKTVSSDRFVYKCNGLSPKDFITSNNITSWRFGGENTTTYNTPSQEDVIDNYFRDSLYQRNEEITLHRQIPEDFFDNVLLFYSPSRTTQTFNLYIGTDTLRTLDATPNNNIYLKLGNSTQIQNIYIPIFGMNELSGITNLNHSLQHITIDSTYLLRWNTSKYTDENSYQFQGLTDNSWGNTFTFFTEGSTTAKTGYILRIEDIQNWAWYLGLEKMAFTTEQAETWEYDQLPSLNPNVEPEPEPPYEPTPDDTPTTQGTPIIPGQPENKINNKGGTGTKILDTIHYDPTTTIQSGNGWGNNQYLVNSQQLVKISELWFSTDWSQTLYKTNPLESVINIKMYPFNLNTENAYVYPSNIMWFGSYPYGAVGTGMPSDFGTFYSLLPNFNGYIDVGTLTLKPYFGSFIDYAPYTTIRIYIPFCGIQKLDPEIIQGKKIHCFYLFDISTGGCYFVITSVENVDGEEKEYVIYYFKGDLGVDISLTKSDTGDKMRNAVISGISNTVKGLELASGVGASGGVSAMTLEPKETLSNKQMIGFQSSISNFAVGCFDTFLKNTLHKESFGTVGSSGNSLDRMLPLQVYLMIERPITVQPSNYAQMVGRPSLVYRKLKDCKGFTSVSTMRNWTCSGTEYEKNLIEKIMSEGVVIK